MRLWKAAALTTATKVYWVIGAMLTTVITARCLGPDGRGVMAAAASWVAMFVTFGHLSLANVAMYLLAGTGRDRVPEVTGSLLAIIAGVSVIGWTIVVTAYVASGGAAFNHIPPAVLAVAFCWLPFLLWIEYANALLIAVGDLPRMNVAQIAASTAAIVLVGVVVGVLRGGPVAALSAMLASYAISMAVGLPRVVSAGRPVVSTAVVRQLLHGSARLHVSAVGTFFYTNAAVILLNQFRPVKEVAYFQLAMQLAVGLQLVPMAIGLVSYYLIARDGADAAWPTHRRLVAHTMLLAVATAAASALAAPWIVQWLAGAEFQPAVPIIRILTLSVFGASLMTIMAPQWVTRGFFLQASGLSLVAIAVGALGNWIFIPRYGMTAAAWTMVASYGVHLAGNGAFVWWIERQASPMIRGAAAS
jgi:O-antigen/teichoic acid export membrane protein